METSTYAKILNILYNLVISVLAVLVIMVTSSNGENLEILWNPYTLASIVLLLLSFLLISKTTIIHQIRPMALLLLGGPTLGGGIAGEKERGEELYRIELLFPKRIYVKESVIASIVMVLTADPEYSQYTLPKHVTAANRSRLLVTLDAPAFKIAAGRETRHVGTVIGNELCIESPNVQWNLQPAASGKQQILARFWFSDTEASLHDLVVTVKVNKIDGLTAKQIFAVATALAILSSAATVVAIVTKLLGN